MSEAAQSTFVYVTYIRTTAEKLWSALTKPEFAKQYWFGMHMASSGSAAPSGSCVSPMVASLTSGRCWRSIRPAASCCAGRTSFGRS